EKEHRLRDAAGEWVWVLSRGKVRESGPLASGRRIVGTTSDVTARKRAEEALVAAKETAEAANRAKTAFLANVSHEIRTPMTAILGFTDVLLQQSAAERDDETLALIRRNGGHLLDVINDILDLSKIEAGKLDLEETPVRLTSILHDVVAPLRGRAADKGLALAVQYATPIPERIFTDPTRLRQVLLNLVSNAVKFTETGSVTVTTAVEPRSADGADGRPPTQRLTVCVQDTGIGMTEEQISHLYEPFHQVDPSMSRRFGGTGLGLAISKRLSEMMGGAITVESRPAVGTRFTLTLPTSAPAEARTLSAVEAAALETPAADAPPPAVDRMTGSVLVVEDGLDNQTLLAFLLRGAGLEVRFADNGTAALSEIEQAEAEGRSFDLVLMDMQMPVMDGYEATRRLRERGFRVPIIALTAHAMQEDRKKCLDAGCDDYISKPIQRAEFLGKLAERLGAVDGDGRAARSTAR
ncbi:MAG: ATP-binding protein, partial [Planctomycetia bacterium]